MADEIKRNCELCTEKATLFCASDSAYLCSACDSKVHCANFLVARHVRSSICPNCRQLDGHCISGVVSDFSPAAVRRKPCRNCAPEEFIGGGEIGIGIGIGVDYSHSTSSSCVSSTTEPGEEEVVSSSSSSKRRERISGGGVCGGVTVAAAVDRRVEEVLVNWCRRLGVEERKSSQVVATAVDLAGGCLSRMTILPFRVSLAAALWVALRLCSGGGGGGLKTCQELRKVEQISGVPAKLILATEARLARVIKQKRSRENHEEGWAEC